MKRPFAILAAGIMASLSIMTGICVVHAQETTEVRPGGRVAPQRLSMEVGVSRIIDLPRDAAEVFVANPRVANAVVRSPRKLYVIGMDTGQTSVVALDQQGNEIGHLELSIRRYIGVGELQQILRTAIPTAAITARTVNDTIILTGIVDSIEDAQRAGDIAKGFVQQDYGAGPSGAQGTQGAGGAQGAQTASVDGRIVNVLTIRGRDQVMLKVTVAEISRDIAKQLGVTTSSLTASWATFTQVNPFPIAGAIAPSAIAPLTAAGVLGTTVTAHNPDNTLTATLSAFERYGVTRILAEPTVSAISGESARLTVGGEVPIPGPPNCTIGAYCTYSIVYKEYGVTLRFTPTVLAEGRIELHLATEVTDIDNTQSAQLIGGFPVPAFLTRKNETTVEVPSGGSIASAGLLQSKSKQVINGLPGTHRLANSRRAVPLARLPAAGDRIDDCRDPLHHQTGGPE